MDIECVESILVDICKKTIFLTSDEGSSKTVQCDTTEQFMNVMKVVTHNADPEMIKYVDVAETE
jgi:hypothetical protein